MLFSKKIVFIGAGNMGEALLGGLINGELTHAQNIVAADVRPERLEEIHEKWGVRTTSNNNEAVVEADIIVLGVKPQMISSVLESLKESIHSEQLIISILAGINTATINKLIGKNNPVIRVMPNMPAVVDAGASGMCLGGQATEIHKELATQILQAVGTVQIVQEDQMDVVTGLSGSGPAYICMIIEALTDGGVMMGLPRDVATNLAIQTVLGSAKLVQDTGIHPAVLRDQVTTPGGTAIAATKELETHGLRPMLIRAVETATLKSRQLRQMADKRQQDNDE